eukprot:scaffold7907_cov163-Skeletonema_marinoi.AAC.12
MDWHNRSPDPDIRPDDMHFVVMGIEGDADPPDELLFEASRRLDNLCSDCDGMRQPIILINIAIYDEIIMTSRFDPIRGNSLICTVRSD